MTTFRRRTAVITVKRFFSTASFTFLFFFELICADVHIKRKHSQIKNSLEFVFIYRHTEYKCVMSNLQICSQKEIPHTYPLPQQMNGNFEYIS